MRIPILTLLLTTILFFRGFSQLSIVEKTLTDLRVTTSSANAIVRQPDGKYVVLGSFKKAGQYKNALIRFDSTGVLDNTFGNGGIDTFTTVNYFPGWQLAFLNAVAIQGDKIIVGGGTASFLGNVTIGAAILMRFTASGKLDSAFGINGRIAVKSKTANDVVIDEVKAIAIATDGRIGIVGSSYNYVKYKVLVESFKPQGLLNTGFNGTGISTFDIDTRDDQGIDIAIRQNNKMVILAKTYTANNNYEVALLSLHEDGTKDTLFGKKGVTVSKIGSLVDIATKMLIMPNGKIICVGTSGNGPDAFNFVLALRYMANGIPDSSFGTKGASVIYPAVFNCQVTGAALQSSGNIVFGGYGKTNKNKQFFVGRLLRNGAVDFSFGNHGFTTATFKSSDDIAYGLCTTPGDNILEVGAITRQASTLMCIAKYTPGGVIDNGFGTGGAKIINIGTSRDKALKMVKLPWDNSFLLSGIANGFWSLVKYKADKSLAVDKDFGVNGTAVVPVSYYDNDFVAPNIAVDSGQQRIFMSGLVNGQLYIYCFKGNGSPDSTWGTNGLVMYSDVSLYYGGLVVTPQHKVVFGAIRQLSTTGYSFLAMLGANGKPDHSFGHNGELRRLKIGVNSIIVNNTKTGLKVGGLVSTGSFLQGFGVASIYFDGSYDSSYGTNGVAKLKIAGGSGEVYFNYSITDDAYGRTLFSGSIMSYNLGGFHFGVARFTANGQPDSSFGNNGIVSFYPATGDKTNPQNDGVAVGCIDNQHCYIATAGFEVDSYFKTAKSVIAVYNNNGSPDSLSANVFWDKHLFGGPYDIATAVYMDDVAVSGYTLYVAGAGGNNDELNFGLAKMQRQIPNLQHYTAYSSSLNAKQQGFLSGLNVFPNPAKNIVNISHPAINKGAVVIQLIDANGKMLRQYGFNSLTGGQFNQAIQLPEGLAGGLYFLKLVNGNNITTKKIIKQ